MKFTTMRGIEEAWKFEQIILGQDTPQPKLCDIVIFKEGLQDKRVGITIHYKDSIHHIHLYEKSWDIIKEKVDRMLKDRTIRGWKLKHAHDMSSRLYNVLTSLEGQFKYIDDITRKTLLKTRYCGEITVDEFFRLKGK